MCGILLPVTSSPGTRLLVIAGKATFGEWERALRARGFDPVRAEAADACAAAAREPTGGVLVSAEDAEGFVACQQLRTDERLRTIPLVLARLPAVTADKHALLRTRADGYAVDPADPGAVAATVERAIRRAPRRELTPLFVRPPPRPAWRSPSLWATFATLAVAAAAWLLLRG